jgi:hypothetical protein
MKISHYVSVKLVMIALACSLAASAPIQAREARANSASARSGDNARLVVTRAANFGTFEFVNLFVDGVQVADLGVNQSYNAVLRPGQHVLSIVTSPQTYSHPTPTQLRINVKPGETYAFTAVWEDFERASLEQL